MTEGTSQLVSLLSLLLPPLLFLSDRRGFLPVSSLSFLIPISFVRGKIFLLLSKVFSLRSITKEEEVGNEKRTDGTSYFRSHVRERLLTSNPLSGNGNPGRLLSRRISYEYCY